MMFFLGFSAATVLWFFVRRWEDKRIDRDIEARLILLDRERGRRIFDKHQRPCPCGRRINHGVVDESAFARDPEWSRDGTEAAPDGACAAPPAQDSPAADTLDAGRALNAQVVRP